MSDAAKALHDRLHFDIASGEIRDGPRRYVVLRADVLMGIFDQLDEDLRRQALVAFGRSVFRFGGGSVQAYLAERGSGQLIRTMEAGSASLGWGTWNLRVEDDRLQLTVANSPFAASTRHGTFPVCYPIAGMLQAIAEALWGTSAEAQELRCACQAPHAGSDCEFEATRVPGQRPAQR